MTKPQPPGDGVRMNAETAPLESETTTPIQPVAAPPTAMEDEDFGDASLGERQPEVCNMEDGCTSCQ